MRKSVGIHACFGEYASAAALYAQGAHRLSGHAAEAHKVAEVLAAVAAV